MPNDSDLSEDPFLITSELEIRSVLRSIQRNASLLRMYARGNPDVSIMTTILALDNDAQQLIVDCSSDAALNANLIKAPGVIFDTQIHQVNVSFPGAGLESISYDDLPAFSLPFPTKMRRIQRREFYRVEIPLGEPATCTIPVTEPGKAPRRAVVKMKDISAGGLALLDIDQQLPHHSGMTFKQVRLALPEVGEATVDLTVQRVHTEVLPNKKEIVELGCQFSNIDRPTAMLVQNYIGRLERRLNAKQRGY